MNESYSVENPEALGLTWDEQTRRLVDPETGEIFALDRVTDEATAKAAAFRLWSTEAGIAILKRQKKALDAQIKARERRLETFRSLYLDDMVAVAKGLMDKAKTKVQTIQIGFAKVGWRTTSQTVAVSDAPRAAAFLAALAPESMKVTIDLALVPDHRRLALALHMLEVAEGAGREAVGYDIKTSQIPASLVASLPADAFAVDPGGKAKWDVKGDKPKEAAHGDE